MSKEIYLAVDKVENDTIIDFEKIKELKKKTGQNVEKIIEENLKKQEMKLSIKELQYYLCDNCYCRLLDMVGELDG